MWACRAALVLVPLIGSCYSPSITTCSLACAANDVCPDGFDCSAGMCAVRGTTCQGGNEDAAVLPDGNGIQCGDMASFTGEVCFKPPVTIATGVNGIFDTQLVDANGDGRRDLVYLGPSGYLFRYNTNNVFSATATAGPAIGTTQRMRGVNLDSGSSPELINAVASAAQIQIWAWDGQSWMRASTNQAAATDIVAISPGRVQTANGPADLAFLFQGELRVYALQAGGNLMTNPIGGTPSITGARDLAIGDFDNNNIGEIAVATTTGLDVYKMVGSVLTRSATPVITGNIAAIGAGDIDNDNDGDLVYVIAGGVGQIGVARWNGAGWDLAPAKTINNLLGQLEIADVDRDGRADAIGAVTQGPNASIVVLRGRADGGLEEPIEIPLTTTLTQLRANGDFNNDGYVDIVVTASVMGTIHVLESNP